MSLYNPYISTLTEGLAPGPGGTFTSIVADGTQIAPTSPVVVNKESSANPITLTDPVSLGSLPITQALQTLSNPNLVRDVQGRITDPIGKIDIGGGSVLTFDPTSLDARVFPALDPANALYDDPGDATFTASDCRIMVEIPQNPGFNGSQLQTRAAKQLLEASTLSISIHRSKSPVRAFGYANPRGFARGSRTIAGTLVLSKSTAEVLYRFLQSGLVADLTRDTIYTKLDQLPPLDFTLLFTNEYGYASAQRLLGVEFVTDGSAVSIQDLLMEQQITWMAMDLTPLAPLNFNTFFSVDTNPSLGMSAKKTPGSVIGSQSSSTLPGNLVSGGGQDGPGIGGSDILVGSSAGLQMVA